MSSRKSTKMAWMPGDLVKVDPDSPRPSDTIDYDAYAQAEIRGLPYPSEIVDDGVKKPLDTGDS